MTASGTFGVGDAGIVENTGTLYLDGATVNALKIGTLTASTGGTINYNLAGAQTVFPGNYYNLILSGSGEKTYAGARAVSYDMTIGSGVTANLDNTITVSGGLKLGTTWKSASSWGFTGSSAANINTTYFSTGTGKVVNALSHTSTTTTTTTTTYTPSSSNDEETTTTTTTTATTTTPAMNTIAGCGARTTGFSSSTGASCVGNTGTATTTPAATVIPGCGNRNTGFSSSSGVSCVGNSVGASSAYNYNFGSAVLKNGSRGEAVMELQRFLNAKLNLNLVVDGMLGPKTIAVIKTWQAANALVADGLVGPATKAKMNAQ